MSQTLELIYLDSSALNRPFDEKTQARIIVESAAMLVVFEMIEQEQVTLVSSEVVDLELNRNPNLKQRYYLEDFMNRSSQYQVVTPDIARRGKELERSGLKMLDALHVSCAEAMEVDAFLTCDDKILTNSAAQVRVVTPTFYVAGLMEGGHNNGDFR